jgi:gluconolactonase
MHFYALLGAATLAALFFSASGGDTADTSAHGRVEQVSPALAQIVPAGARVEKLAGGFAFTEGPIWTYDGHLLFSDIPNNVILAWDRRTGVVSDFRRPSAHTNGNTLDHQGRLICCEHSGRRLSRQEADGSFVTVVDNYQGKRLNSPNDVVVKSDGSLYFTDPPYGLPRQDDDPAKELDHNGTYRFQNGTLTLLATDLRRPNGLAFSPDESILYVANSDSARKLWMAYPVRADGTLGDGRVFFDASASREDGLPDGMKVDTRGNVYGTGPGGVWVFNPQGQHLGTIRPAEVPANCHWGDDGRTLYMTSRTGLYRIRLSIPGIRP